MLLRPQHPRQALLPLVRAGLVRVMAVAAGADHTMVLKQDGSLWGTGSNKYGQLGDESTTEKNIFVKVIASGVKAVATVFARTMALKQDGSLWGTGWNDIGQLGDGSTTDKKTFVKVITSGVTAVAAGGWHTVAVKQDGSLWATRWRFVHRTGIYQSKFTCTQIPTVRKIS